MKSDPPVLESCVIILPFIKNRPDSRFLDSSLTRAQESCKLEIIGLAKALDLFPVHIFSFSLQRVCASTFFGSGKIAELSDVIKEKDTSLVLVDHSLTPVQQRNLEKSLNAKVLDRVGIILEIFAKRARTREGVLQVELACLEYQKSRLVRSWTHLERQKGGRGFLAGPGETQIESDRRRLRDKINKLKPQIKEIRRTRNLHRLHRKKVAFPSVSLVGYTNAGKSTLFNRLVGESVKTDNSLFCTLDPTSRGLRLPHGSMAILSDTVGFISNLPAHLIAAFKGTLEETAESDLILHLRDVSDPDFETQAESVYKILRDLDVDPLNSSRVIEIWNKIDCLDESQLRHFSQKQMKEKNYFIGISALEGQGVQALPAIIEKMLLGSPVSFTVCLKPSQFHLVQWFYRNTIVKDCMEIEAEEGLCLTVESTQAMRREAEKNIAI